jgi:hypothetical protein
MLRNIINVEKFGEDYHSTDNHVITINGVLANNIVIKFISSNRNDTSYKIDYVSDTRELSYSDRITYAAMNNMYKKVVRDIEEIFCYLEIDISKEEVNKIGDIVCKCISKCESRYGMKTKDFDTYEADAILTIQGEDNGKEKHIVKFYDELSELLVEDYPITYGSGRVVKESNYIKWLVDKDSCSFNDLLTEVISSFENPYLIISNEYEIILDFRFDSSKYEGTQNAK